VPKAEHRRRVLIFKTAPRSGAGGLRYVKRRAKT